MNYEQTVKDLLPYLKHTNDCPVAIVHYEFSQDCNCGLTGVMELMAMVDGSEVNAHIAFLEAKVKRLEGILGNTFETITAARSNDFLLSIT